MPDQLIPQRTNPARDLYKFLYGIAQHTSPANLEDRGDRMHASVFYFQAGLSLTVNGNWPWMNGKPPLSIGHLMTVWPNGDFLVSVGVRHERWWNDERNLLAKYTFLQWQPYVAYKDKAVFVQDHMRAVNCAYRYDACLSETDYTRRRPYLTCQKGADLFHRDVIYRLYRVEGTFDWKIRAVDRAPDTASGLPREVVRKRLREANKLLDENYAIAEARYARHERKAEIESWRERGFANPPRERSQVKRDEIIRTFIDHSIVFEPKSGPHGQDILPFTLREEAMAHGR